MTIEKRGAYMGVLNDEMHWISMTHLSRASFFLMQKFNSKFQVLETSQLLSFP